MDAFAAWRTEIQIPWSILAGIPFDFNRLKTTKAASDPWDPMAFGRSQGHTELDIEMDWAQSGSQSFSLFNRKETCLRKNVKGGFQLAAVGSLVRRYNSL